MTLEARHERERELFSRLQRVLEVGGDRLLLQLVDVVVVQGAVVGERRLVEELEAAERWVAAGCPLPGAPSPGSTLDLLHRGADALGAMGIGEESWAGPCPRTLS